MSLPIILKNIYTFANILSQASTDAVATWNEKSLQNAFNWARYCQQIEQQMQGKSYWADLNQQIRCLTLYLKPVSLIELGLEILGDSEVTLTAVLLGNPCITADTRTRIKTYIGDRHCQKSTPADSLDFTRSRKLSVFIGGLDRAPNSSSQFLANILMAKLVRLRSLASTSERFIKFLESVLEEISAHISGWEVVLYTLLTEVGDQDNHTPVETIKDLMLNWITKTCDIESEIWHSNTELLAECSSRSDQFLEIYLSHIVTWGGAMDRDYQPPGSLHLYTWSYHGQPSSQPSNTDLSYRSLVHQWSAILTHNHRTRVKVERRLTYLGQQSHFNIWKDVMHSVQLDEY